MPILNIFPHGGINTRFPEHRITSEKKTGVQKVRALNNLISLDGSIKIVPGATPFDSTAKAGTVSWAKRIYHQDLGDPQKNLFVDIGGKIYRGIEATQTLEQVTINNSLDISLEANFYPISTTALSAGTPCTYKVD